MEATTFHSKTFWNGLFHIGRLHVYRWKDCEFVADLKNGLTFPNANKTESKYSITPKSTKKIPNPVRPMPISEKKTNETIQKKKLKKKKGSEMQFFF